MSQKKLSQPHIEALRVQLKESLFLDLDDYGLEELEGGQFISTFLGIQLHSAFQPIYDSEAGELYGHEGLLRPSLGNVQVISPEFSFSYAEQAGHLVQFDRVCRTLHVLNFRELFAESGKLFLNVHPKLLVSVNAHGKVFERILHSNSVPTSRVVIEIDESAVEQDKALLEAVQNYRDRGYGIALGNFGRRQSNLDRLWKLFPDYVKLDLSIIHEAEHSPRLSKALAGIVKTIRDLGAQPVIEGIENQVQLDLAVESGSTLLQGYLLGRPATASELKSTQKSFKPTIRAAA